MIPENGKVTVLAKANSRWYRVRYKGTVGYIAAGYFKSDNTVIRTKRTVKTAIYIRKTMVVGIRSNIVAVVPAGKQVTILSQVNSKWYEVSYGKKSGYMKAGYFL